MTLEHDNCDCCDEPMPKLDCPDCHKKQSSHYIVKIPSSYIDLWFCTNCYVRFGTPHKDGGPEAELDMRGMPVDEA